jgi:protein gp37
LTALIFLYQTIHFTVGGETGRDARICDYDWILAIREQCIQAGITFWFKNTGSLFRYDGKVQKINPFKQSSVAKEFGINFLNDKKLF